MEMHAVDREIMIGLLKPQPSMYELKKSLKIPYATMLRHIRKLGKNRLVLTEKAIRRNGKPDNRKTVRLRLTEFGLATIIVKGSLNDKELKLASERLSPKEFSQIRFLARGLGVTSDSILKSIFDKAKRQMNLEYFDSGYFHEIILLSFAETLIEVYRNMTDSKRKKLDRITMQSIKKNKGVFVSSTKELTNEILDVLEKKQRKLTAMIDVLKGAMGNIEKSK